MGWDPCPSACLCCVSKPMAHAMNYQPCGVQSPEELNSWTLRHPDTDLMGHFMSMKIENTTDRWGKNKSQFVIVINPGSTDKVLFCGALWERDKHLILTLCPMCMNGLHLEFQIRQNIWHEYNIDINVCMRKPEKLYSLYPISSVYYCSSFSLTIKSIHHLSS